LKKFLGNFPYIFVERVLAPTIKWLINGKIYFLFWKLGSGWRYSVWKARLGSLGRFSIIHSNVIILAPKRVYIGCNVAIAEFVHIRALGGVYIGDNSMIATHVTITSVTHDVNTTVEAFRDTNVIKPVVIEKNVWIGSNVVILPGITIGEGSVVGAGSVVTHDIPPRAVAVGVPARIIRYLEK